MSNQFRGNLKPAHRGYQYQDLLTAFVLAESLARKYEKVIIDKKIATGDCFDDLEVQFGRMRRRIQIKSSEKDKRQLQSNDFTNKTSSIRIDHLIKSYINTKQNPSDEYRLCATWDSTDNEELENLLIAVPNAFPTIVKSKTKIFQLDINLLWPKNKDPLWHWLKEGSLKRDQVEEFCAHFFIELNLPRATRNLREPGELEDHLIQLLANRIGIGRYPNNGREPHDVAALLIAVANSARSDSQTLEPTQIEHLLNLQTDFGCLSQEFPVNPETFQDRDSLRPKLIELILKGNHIILTGSPGIGKSWELTELVADLRKKGALVAYHYCYLNPGDQYIEQRITSNVLFGNLQAGLVNYEPSLRSKMTSYYSSGLRELEELLHHAGQLETPIVLIIDGLDHISRVLADSHSISHLEADIIDHLATLNVPKSVSIVLGSQPGNHLHSLENKLADRLENVNVLPWSNADIVELARSLETEQVLLQHKIDPEDVLEKLAVKSEGNPLFATYLARQLCIAIENGSVTEVGDWFEQIPPIEGDIETYYSYLYRSSINTAQAIADLLGVMDFAVTKDELRSILPPINHRWLEPALQYLEPILIEVTLQGGIRIFHESFRRFMNRELYRQGHSLTDVLQPVIIWLQNEGFFEDAKAYRFLLPLLQRSDQADAALELIQADFVAKSVASGHPYEAVERNLLVAASIAGKHSRWVEIIRCAELIRAAYTCYEDKLYDPVLYWETFLHLFGTNALVRSLLFEGKITQTAEIGLILCSMADDAGAAPPWQEYLSAYQQMDNDQEDRSDDSKFPYQVSLARIHGEIRTMGFDNINQSIYEFLLEHGFNHPHPEYICDLGARISYVAGIEAVEQFAVCEGEDLALDKEVIALLQVGAAKTSAEAHNYNVATQLADKALPNLTSPIYAIECIELGATAGYSPQSITAPSTIELYLNSYPDNDADTNVREWWALLRLLSSDDPSIIEYERNRIQGEGWYRCWLNFILLLVESEQALELGAASPTICDAFDALTVDMRPFVGKPRTCDLYQLHHVIGDTLEWGLSLLDSPEDWQYALNVIQLVRDNISTSLDAEPSGPIYTSTILNILQRSITRLDLVPIIKTYIENEIAKDDARGTYFEFHAEHNMRYASVLMSIGDIAKSTNLWHQICIYLSSYGFRKDITLYEITESIPALLNKDKQAAFNALAITQPLTEIVINHTDGRSTNHAPLNWFGNLLECDLSAGLSLLSQSIAKPYASVGWQIEDALSKALDYCADESNPILADILCDILPFHIDYESEALEKAEVRLSVIERLYQNNATQAQRALYRLAAQVTGDSKYNTEGAKGAIDEFVFEKNLILPVLSNGNIQSKTEEATKKFKRHSDLFKKLDKQQNIFSEMNFIELLAEIRLIHRLESESEDEICFINGFGYRLSMLIDDGYENDVIRLLRFFGRNYSSRDDLIHPVGKIAEGLDRLGYERVAAVAYVIAYVGTYGGGGYLSLGGEKHIHVFIRAVELNRAVALETLGDELSVKLAANSYNVGVTRHLIQLLSAIGEFEQTEICWLAAYEVIKFRLPSEQSGTGVLIPFHPNQIPAWSINESTVAVILSQLHNPILQRKIATLFGFGQVIKRCPLHVIEPLKYFLTQNITTSSLTLILDTLRQEEEAPYDISNNIGEILLDFSKSELWGIRVLASELLLRVGKIVQSVNYPCPIQPLSTISERDNAMLTWISGGENRRERLIELWPELLELTWARFKQIYKKGTIHDDLSIRDARLEFGRDGTSYPPTPVLRWESEIFETALNDTLNGFSAYLWQTGQRETISDRQALKEILPASNVHVGFHASRVPRPNYPNLEDLTERITEVTQLENDPLYLGWSRLGYWERHWLSIDQNSYSPPDQITTSYSGLVIEFDHLIPKDNVFPFNDINPENWWGVSPKHKKRMLRLMRGQLVGISRVSDWLGDDLVLVPPPELIEKFDLRFAKHFEQMEWTDSRGDPGIVLRTWQIRDKQQFQGEPLEFKGSDLIMRPDLFNKLKHLVSYPIHQLSITVQTDRNVPIEE